MTDDLQLIQPLDALPWLPVSAQNSHIDFDLTLIVCQLNHQSSHSRNIKKIATLVLTFGKDDKPK